MHLMLIDPALSALLVGVLALMFAAAAIHKLRDLGQFAQIFANYGLLPWVSRWHLSWCVPVLEVAVAVALLLPPTRLSAASVAALLLSGYAAAMAINLHAGRTSLACGCGVADQSQPIAAWMVARNLLLLPVLAFALCPSNARALQWTDFMTVVLGVAVLALLYASAERLLSLPSRQSLRAQGSTS